MNLRRLVYCGLLDTHVGNIESALVDWEGADLTLVFMPCSRCGDLVPLDLEPRRLTEARLEAEARKPERR